MEKDSVCECCGAKLVEYKHSLSKGLARCFYRIIQAGPGEHELSELGMTYSQRSNFSKLKYWGLVAKIGDPSGKGGKWIVTNKGWNFAYGEIEVPKTVWTFRDAVQRFEGDNVSIETITGGYKYRPEYAADAKPHNCQ